jgi:hypothetical protein
MGWMMRKNVKDKQKLSEPSESRKTLWETYVEGLYPSDLDSSPKSITESGSKVAELIRRIKETADQLPNDVDGIPSIDVLSKITDLRRHCVSLLNNL